MAQSEQPDSPAATLRLLDECRYQRDSCLRTAAAFYLWYRSLKFWHGVWLAAIFVIATLTMIEMVLGFGGIWSDAIATAGMLLTAGAVAGYYALYWNPRFEDISDAIAEFRALGDRLGSLAVVQSPGFAEELRQLLQRKDAGWRAAPPLPARWYDDAKSAASELFPNNRRDPPSSDAGMIERPGSATP